MKQRGHFLALSTVRVLILPEDYSKRDWARRQGALWRFSEIFVFKSAPFRVAVGVATARPDFPATPLAKSVILSVDATTSL